MRQTIDFTLKRAVMEVYYSVRNPEVKHDIKEAIEFTSEQSNKQVRLFHADLDFEQEVKKAFDL